MNRLQEKNELYIQLGKLFGPLQRLVEHAHQYDDQERAETLAEYFADFPSVIATFKKFCLGQPGRDYAIQFHNFREAVGSLQYRIINGEPFDDVVRQQALKAQAAIDEIPVPRTSVILIAGNPFTAYCRLCQLCEVDATKSVVWLDPYMAATIFGRFISKVRPNVPVTLVTSEPSSTASRRDRDRWSDFLDVSRLYARERTPARYTLVVNERLHDRWVVYDDKRIYSLGGSAKDAADRDYFTITDVEGSQVNVQLIHDHVMSGVEWFGPSSQTHR